MEKKFNPAQNIQATIIKKGEVRNPNGKQKGTKNTMTVVREFLDKKVKTLDKGNGEKVTRFEYMLLSMYEIAQRLQKQCELYKVEYDTLKEATKDLNLLTEDSKELKKLKALNKTRKQYETFLAKTQEAHIRLSEFFLKSSGQLLEKKKIEHIGPPQVTIVNAGKEDIEVAVQEIRDEL